MWGELSIPPLAEGEVAATLSPSEADLPSNIEAIVPADLTIWQFPQQTAAATPAPPMFKPATPDMAAETALAATHPATSTARISLSLGILLVTSAAFVGWLAAGLVRRRS